MSNEAFPWTTTTPVEPKPPEKDKNESTNSSSNNSDSNPNTDSSVSGTTELVEEQVETKEEQEALAIPDQKVKGVQSANINALKHAKVLSFLQKMPSASNTNPYYNLSVYGPGGSGKTTFGLGIVRCIPENKDVFYIDVENSVISILNRQNPVNPYVDRIKPYKPKDFEEFRQIVESMADLSVEDNPMGAVVIDTVGEVAEDTVTEVLQRNVRRTTRNAYLSSEHEYRERNERMRRVFKMLRDMSIHVVLISHENSPDPDKGLGYRPQLSETVAKMVVNNCDIQIHMTGELKGNKFDGKAEITAGITSNSSLKTRIMGLPPTISNPKMEHIFQVAKPTRSSDERTTV